MPSPSDPQRLDPFNLLAGKRNCVTLNRRTATKVSIVSKTTGLKIEFIVLPGQSFWLTPEHSDVIDVFLDDVEQEPAIGVTALPDGDPGRA